MSWSQWKLTGKIKIIGFKFRKTNSRRGWYDILMPDTVIARVNTLGGNQLGQLTFTDQYGHFIGDVQIPGVPPETPTTLEPDNVYIQIPGVELEDNVELPGVYVDDNEIPQIVEINDYLDIPAQDPPLIELEPATKAAL